MTKQELALEVIERLKRNIRMRIVLPDYIMCVEIIGKCASGCTVYRCEGECGCAGSVRKISYSRGSANADVTDIEVIKALRTRKE